MTAPSSNQYPGCRAPRPGSAAAFTLVEILVAIAILVLVVSVTYGIFSATTKAWQRGKVVSDSLQHGDFVMEQLVMGLRSTYYRDNKSGFWLVDGGQGSSARDEISWVKLGPALVGSRSEVAKGSHRVRFTVENDGDHPAAVIRAWSPESYLQPENFDADTIEPIVLSRHVVGFSCRIGKLGEEGTIEWVEEWETTNMVPRTVELTLYLQPLKDDDEPTEMRRCVSIPVGNADAK